jgi:hypothetical protein
MMPDRELRAALQDLLDQLEVVGNAHGRIRRTSAGLG